jgi:hypothetical protein
MRYRDPARRDRDLTEQPTPAGPARKRKQRAWPRELLGIGILVAFWLVTNSRVLSTFFYKVYNQSGHVDSLGQIWMSWWAQQAIYSDRYSILFCPLINTPIGSEVFTYDLAFMHVLTSGLLRPHLGPIGALNAVFVTGVALSLAGVYLLLRQFNRTRVLCAGLACLSVMYILCVNPDYSDLELNNMGFMTLTVALWIRLLRKGGKALIAATGLLLALTGLSQMYYGADVYLMLGLALLMAPLKLAPVTRNVKVVWVSTGAVIGIGLVLTLLPMIPSMQILSHINVVPPDYDLADCHEMADRSLKAWAVIPVLPLAVMAVVGRTRRLWFWVAAVAMFLLLALGPCLTFGDTSLGDTQVPAPFILLRKWLPFVWRLSFPLRFGRMAIVAMAIFFCVWELVIRKRYRYGARTQAAVVAGLLVAMHLLAPLAVNRTPGVAPDLNLRVDNALMPEVPAVLHTMAADGEDYAVLDVLCDETHPAWAAYYQVVHGKPIAGTPTQPAFLQDPQRPTSRLTRFQKDFCDEALYSPPSIEWLQEQGVRYVMVYYLLTLELGPEWVASWDGAYGEPVFYNEGLPRIYAIPPAGSL